MLGRNQPASGKGERHGQTAPHATPLLAVLAASLLANLVLLGLLLRPPQRPDVSGAYALGTDVSSLTEDDRYLVVYDDGGYLLYQRYQVLDSGRYSVEVDKGARFRFTSDRRQGSYLAVFARPDTLYLPDRDTGIGIYSRHMDTSTIVFGPEEIVG